MWRRWIVLSLVLAGLAAPGGPAFAACVLGKVGELAVTMAGLTPTISAKIDGRPLKMVVDTGAFFSMLTPQAAVRLGLKVVPTPADMGDYIEGLGGPQRVGVATAKSFTLMGDSFHDADFTVGAPQLGGWTDGLLGENILGYADVELDLANGVIRLFKPEGCNDDVDLAYWAPAGGYSSIRIQPATAPMYEIVGHVQVNGHDMRAVFDTGAGRSYITRRAAREAGVTTQSPGVRAGGVGGGIGRRPFETWIAPFRSFRIGDEKVENTELRIGGASIADADMLIGADFFLSHRVYISNSQHRLYFSYLGGPVFRLSPAPGAAPMPAPPPAAASATPIPGAPDDAPMTAGAFGRRGAAFAARRDYADAIADFTRAAAMAPADPRFLYQRALARFAEHQPALARSDLDAALTLKPHYADALMARADLRLAAHDGAGARADFDAAERLDPTLRLRAAETYLAQGDFEPAIVEFDAWIAANPKGALSPAAFNGRCWARALWGHDLNAALADCDEALRLGPHVSSFLDSRGLVNLRLRRFDDAIADYDRSLRLQPKNPWSLYGRGLARLEDGQKAAGEADLVAAEALDPKLAGKARQYGLAP